MERNKFIRSNNNIYFKKYINLMNISKYQNTTQILMGINDSFSNMLSCSYIYDLQYCWRVPMPHIYPSIESNVLKTNRFLFLNFFKLLILVSEKLFKLLKGNLIKNIIIKIRQEYF